MVGAIANAGLFVIALPFDPRWATVPFFFAFLFINLATLVSGESQYWGWKLVKRSEDPASFYLDWGVFAFLSQGFCGFMIWLAFS